MINVTIMEGRITLNCATDYFQRYNKLAILGSDKRKISQMRLFLYKFNKNLITLEEDL